MNRKVKSGDITRVQEDLLEMTEVSDEWGKRIVSLMKFMNKLRDRIPANDVAHYTKCQFCGGKFIVSKSRRSGHMSVNCFSCDISMIE